MHLIEIPRSTPHSGWPLSTEKHAAVRQHLTAQFGELTAFTRSPAQGTATGRGKIVHNDSSYSIS
jgi:hypothetical protein